MSKPIESRRSVGAKRSQATEQAILDAAEEILRMSGPSGLKMEAVAKAARASKATLYKWWPTRGALLLAVYQRNRPQFNYQDTGKLESDLLAAIQVIFDRWQRLDGDLFRYIIAEAQLDEDVFAKLADYRQARIDGLGHVFDRARVRGELGASVDVSLASEWVVSFLWQRLLSQKLDAPIGVAVATFVGAITCENG